jgi:hypothetical protein
MILACGHHFLDVCACRRAQLEAERDHYKARAELWHEAARRARRRARFADDDACSVRRQRNGLMLTSGQTLGWWRAAKRALHKWMAADMRGAVREEILHYRNENVRLQARIARLELLYAGALEKCEHLREWWHEARRDYAQLRNAIERLVR